MDAGTVLVTGGSGGIGGAIVARLVADGWTVAFTYCTSEAAADAAVRATDGRARAFRLDLRDRDRAGALIEEVEEALGPITGLVNNAAVRRDGLLAMTSDADWDDVLEVNLGGPFRLCRSVLPLMVSRRRGSIVNVASLSALRGLAGQAVYAATKAGLVGMTRSLAREIGKRNIRVNAVLPGFVATEMTASAPSEIVAVLRSSECLKPGVSAGDVADLIAFLLSDRSAAITGQALVVDAGSSA